MRRGRKSHTQAHGKHVTRAPHFSPGKKRARRRAGGTPPTLVLTGRRGERKYIAEVDGVRVDLTCREVCTLCELAAARLGNIGPPSLDRMAVRRLREALDDGTGRPGLGDALVVPVPKGKYLLAVAAEKIVVEPSVRELLLAGCIDQVVADTLLAWSERRSAVEPPPK